MQAIEISQHKHLLYLTDLDKTHRCDVCKDDVTDKSFRCPSCDFDVCFSCVHDIMAKAGRPSKKRKAAADQKEKQPQMSARMMHHMNGRVKFELLKPSHQLCTLFPTPAVLKVIAEQWSDHNDRGALNRLLQDEFGLASQEERDQVWELLQHK